MAYMENIDQKYEKQIFWDLNYEDFEFSNWLKNMHIAHIWNTAHNNTTLINLGFSATVVLVSIFV